MENKTKCTRCSVKRILVCDQIFNGHSYPICQKCKDTIVRMLALIDAVPHDLRDFQIEA